MLTFEEAKQQYLDFRQAIGRQPSTINQNRLALNRLFCFCKIQFRLQDLCEITESHLLHYHKWLVFHGKTLRGASFSAGQIRDELRQLCSFFLWHLKRGNLLSNPTEALELPRCQMPSIGCILTHREMENLLSTPDCENILELRDKAVMELMYSSALRISEVCGLLINDVDTQNRTVWIRQGKAGSNRLVPMGKRAAFWLEKYRTESRPVLEKGLYTKPSNHQPRDNHRFFLSIFGCPLSGDSFSLRLKTYLKKAGIPRGNGQTHLFRRTCATHLHEAGMDIRLIQVLLGHKNLQMTVRYTQVNLKKLREVHELFHPQSVKEVNREK